MIIETNKFDIICLREFIFRINQSQMTDRYKPHPIILGKMFLSFENRSLPQVKINNEFDDANMSATPLSFLAKKNEFVVNQQYNSQLELRKLRIKNKIKNQVRQKIKEIANKQMNGHFTPKKQESSLRNYDYFCKSQLFNSRLPLKKQSGDQISSNCMIQQLQLHKKLQVRSSMRTRNRIINSVMENRVKARSSFNHRSSNIVKAKMSVSNSNNYRQNQGESLQPWKFSDDMVIDENFSKSIFRKK